MRHWIHQYATAGLAASALAAESLYGAHWRQDSRWRVLHCGIELTPFLAPAPGGTDLRADLGLGTDSFVIGHVGRFDSGKNHALVLRTAAMVMATTPSARLLLVGDGGLRSDIAQQARSLGIESKVVMTGIRQDVPRLMTAAMDCFLLPSFYEGLPLVLLEAQAAGLPCIVSDSVSEEAVAIPDLVDRVSLGAHVGRWAEAVLATRGRKLPAPFAVRRLEASSFSVGASWAQLLQVYSGTLPS